MALRELRELLDVFDNCPVRRRAVQGGMWQRFRRKWAIWRVGQPSCSKCIVTRRLVSITYDLGPIVKASYLRQLSREN
jgi:hypothetical protein